MSEKETKEKASEVYDTYAAKFRRRFKWLKPHLFNDDLARDLLKDAKALMGVLRKYLAGDADGEHAQR